MSLLTFAARNKNRGTRKHSSSGGVFYSLAKFIIENGGVVFGAAFNSNWDVNIRYVDVLDDLDSLLTSKYVLANVKNTFQETKKFLDQGKMVLYSSVPCQLFALKKFLQKDYNNLICVSIACHGTMDPQIWNDYLNSINRDKITNINMRDKSNGWREYNVRIDFSDGTKIIENNGKNAYMRLFLSDLYLRDSCYHCIYKKREDIADLVIGDLWSVNKIHHLSQWDDDTGVNFIIVNNAKVNNILNNISDLDLKAIDNRYAYMDNGWFIETVNKPKKIYNKNSFLKERKKISIISQPICDNIGGVLQAYALSKYLENEGNVVLFLNPQCDNFESKHLPFIDKYINTLAIQDANSYDTCPRDSDVIIVGSDQVWRQWWNYINQVFLDFALGWNVKKIAYAASFGVNKWEYDKKLTRKVKFLSRGFDAISVREIDAVEMCKRHLHKNVEQILDPTILLSKSEYEYICNKIKQKSGFFAYILDNSKFKSVLIEGAKNKFNSKQIIINQKNVEEWLAAFRDAEFIITDSFHGCMFSIIFNKPFLCIKNKGRGINRFESLTKKFNINDRFIDENDRNLNLNLLKKPIDRSVSEILNFEKQKSFNFLNKNIYGKKKMHLKLRENILKIVLAHIIPPRTRRRNVFKKIIEFPIKIYRRLKKFFE